LSKIWNEDQAKLLDFSVRNFFATFKQRNRYLSKKYYLAVPFDSGYRSFDIVANSLEEIVFKASETLKSTEFDRLNIEQADGIPILTIYLEKGPTVVIKDIVTEKTICSVQL